MKARSEFSDALKLFAKEMGVPTQLDLDLSEGKKSNESKKVANDIGLDMCMLEESTQ